MIVAALAVVASVLQEQGYFNLGSPDKTADAPVSESATRAPVTISDDDRRILSNAIEQQKNDVQVRGVGRVIKVLRDDVEGSRHQRFLIDIGDDRTLLVAHNIDLAPRVKDIRVGDDVFFYGVYEWNNKGGVIHWTHHDPRGRHIGGWLKHRGQTYE